MKSEQDVFSELPISFQIRHTTITRCCNRERTEAVDYTLVHEMFMLNGGRRHILYYRPKYYSDFPSYVDPPMPIGIDVGPGNESLISLIESLVKEVKKIGAKYGIKLWENDNV